MYLETWSWSSLICVEKASSRGSEYMESRENVYFNIFVLFIVDTTSILKLVFPTIVFPAISVFMLTLVAVLLSLLLLLLLFLFIYFFIFSFYLFILLFCFFVYLFIYFFLLLQLLFLFLLLLLSTVAFDVWVIVAFCVLGCCC